MNPDPQSSPTPTAPGGQTPPRNFLPIILGASIGIGGAIGQGVGGDSIVIRSIVGGVAAIVVGLIVGGILGALTKK